MSFLTLNDNKIDFLKITTKKNFDFWILKPCEIYCFMYLFWEKTVFPLRIQNCAPIWAWFVIKTFPNRVIGSFLIQIHENTSRRSYCRFKVGEFLTEISRYDKTHTHTHPKKAIFAAMSDERWNQKKTVIISKSDGEQCFEANVRNCDPRAAFRDAIGGQAWKGRRCARRLGAWVRTVGSRSMVRIAMSVIITSLMLSATDLGNACQKIPNDPCVSADARKRMSCTNIAQKNTMICERMTPNMSHFFCAWKKYSKTVAVWKKTKYFNNYKHERHLYQSLIEKLPSRPHRICHIDA